MGQIQESNSQYYSGQKILDNSAGVGVKEFTFPNYNTELVSAFGSPEVPPGLTDYTRIGSSSNFNIYHGTGTPLVFTLVPEENIQVKDPTNNTIEIASGNAGFWSPDRLRANHRALVRAAKRALPSLAGPSPRT